jgi:hypothetical protein
MRLMSHSAWCISSRACFWMALWSLSYPQFSHISECTTYWLMAVYSSARSSFNPHHQLFVTFHFSYFPFTSICSS